MKELKKINNINKDTYLMRNQQMFLHWDLHFLKHFLVMNLTLIKLF
jgi:hypothetical protein